MVTGMGGFIDDCRSFSLLLLFFTPYVVLIATGLWFLLQHVRLI